MIKIWIDEAIHIASTTGPYNGWLAFETLVSDDFYKENADAFDIGDEMFNNSSSLNEITDYIKGFERC
jgi:hypothetical protein